MSHQNYIFWFHIVRLKMGLIKSTYQIKTKAENIHLSFLAWKVFNENPTSGFLTHFQPGSATSFKSPDYKASVSNTQLDNLTVRTIHHSSWISPNQTQSYQTRPNQPNVNQTKLWELFTCHPGVSPPPLGWPNVALSKGSHLGP